MVFSDLFFLFVFLPAFMLMYMIACWIDRKITDATVVRNAVLVMFSLLFYAWGEPVYIFLMLFSSIINYFCGLCIAGADKHRKAALVMGLTANLSLLGVFKYLGFFSQQLAALGIPVDIPRIALPIGISFYTFQSISYLVDVYRRTTPVQRNYGSLLLYISMFPQLIAGPIVRYDLVAKELSDRHVSADDFVEGAYRFFIGLGKKVIIANQMSEIATQFLGQGLGNASTAGVWVGIVAFTLQIFFDFSGYSDMAIGLGRCMGFHFAENFDHPYCSTTITEFWRRWHMSLGQFFRDYVYIPLGGNRRHQVLNILIVWFLTGMWHGACWNFIIWGVYFGIIVMLEKYTILRWKKYIPNLFLHVYAIALFTIGWGIFYFDDFSRMLLFFEKGFGGGAELYDFTVESALTGSFWLWIAALVFCLPVYDLTTKLFNKVWSTDGAVRRGVVMLTKLSISIALLLVSITLLVGATNNAFLYTRF